MDQNKVTQKKSSPNLDLSPSTRIDTSMQDYLKLQNQIQNIFNPHFQSELHESPSHQFMKKEKQQNQSGEIPLNSEKQHSNFSEKLNYKLNWYLSGTNQVNNLPIISIHSNSKQQEIKIKKRASKSKIKTVSIQSFRKSFEMEKQSSPHFCIRSKKSLVKESLYCYHIDKKVHKKAYSQQKGGNSLFWDKSKSSEISLTILPMFQEKVEFGQQKYQSQKPLSLNRYETHENINFQRRVYKEDGTSIIQQIGSKSVQTEQNKKIFHQDSINFINNSNYETYLEKMRKNYEDLVSDLTKNNEQIQIKKNIESNKQYMNCGTYCNEKLISRRLNLKRVQLIEKQKSEKREKEKPKPKPRSRSKKVKKIEESEVITVNSEDQSSIKQIQKRKSQHRK